MFHDLLHDFWVRVTGEVTSVLIVIGVIAQALPAVASLLAIIWYFIQIWQSSTVQKIFGRAPRPGPPSPTSN